MPRYTRHFFLASSRFKINKASHTGLAFNFNEEQFLFRVRNNSLIAVCNFPCSIEYALCTLLQQVKFNF